MKKKLPTEILYEVLDCVEACGDIEGVRKSDEFDGWEIKVKMHAEFGAPGVLCISTEGMNKIMKKVIE